MGLMGIRRRIMESGPREIPQYETVGPADIVTLESDWAMPMKSLKVAINPVQDLHGHENPWPAGGGKNKFDPNSANHNWVGINGVITQRDANKTCKIPIASGTSVTLSNANASSATNILLLAFFDSNDTLLSRHSLSTGETYITATAPENTAYVMASFFTWSEASYAQLELGSTATAYAPYENICPITGWTGAQVVVSPTQDAQDGTTYSVSWETEAGTVYGGTLDVVSGELVVDRYFVDPTQWTQYNASNGYKAYRINYVPYGLYNSDLSNKPLSNMISKFGSFSSSAMSKNIIQVPRANANSAYMALREDIDPTLVEFTYLMSNPQTYHLTPQEVRTLLGQNNVWSDTGDSTVEYYADTKRYIDKRIAEIVN